MNEPEPGVTWRALFEVVGALLALMLGLGVCMASVFHSGSLTP